MYINKAYFSRAAGGSKKMEVLGMEKGTFHQLPNMGLLQWNKHDLYMPC